MRPPPARLRPYRLFFPLAALGGSVAVAAIVAERLDLVALGPEAMALHGHEMLHGHFVAAFAGVMLTALPRWTGAPPVAPLPLLGLASLWAVARIAVFAGASAATPLAPVGLVLSALVVLAAAGWAGSVIVRTGDRRDAVVPLLLGLLGVADLALLAEVVTPRTALMIALSGAIGVATLMGGRIAPALTRHLALAHDRVVEPTMHRGLEAAVAVATATALTLWCRAPDGPATVVACALAALLHAARLAGWRGWTTLSHPAIAAVHVGYGFMVVGFALLAIAALDGDGRFADAARHAFGTGVLGLMCFAVQASVLRAHEGRALTADRLGDVAAGLLFAATLARLAAPFLDDARLVTSIAGLAWLAAQAALPIAVLTGLRAERSHRP